MRFSTLLYLPLISTLTSVILASPTQAETNNELVSRDDTTSIEARTFFWLHDYRCFDWSRKWLCQLKGSGWACNKDCSCSYKPPVCGDYCPDRDDKMKDCKNRWGCSWDDQNCKCNEPKCKKDDYDKCCAKNGDFNNDNCGCTCKAWDKENCLKDGGSFNDHECKCTPKPKPPPTCDKNQDDHCCSLGGKWDNDKCTCQMPNNTCKDWLSVWKCKLLGKKCNQSCSCW